MAMLGLGRFIQKKEEKAQLFGFSSAFLSNSSAKKKVPRREVWWRRTSSEEKEKTMNFFLTPIMTPMAALRQAPIPNNCAYPDPSCCCTAHKMLWWM